jgi:hypothetical protein
LSSSDLQGGNTLGKGSSIHFLHLGHNVFDGMSHEGHKRAMSCPIHRISEALNEGGGNGDGDSLLLRMGSGSDRLVVSIERRRSA